MRSSVVAIGVVIAALAASAAHAQRTAPKLWDLKLGTPLAALPSTEFVDPACGTNGGPPAKVLKSFAEFAQCTVEPGTGLREIWFRYDDEMEYVGRARRSDIMTRQFSQNSLAGQPIITSLLVDDAGLVQGYRIVNDPRVDSDTRIAAFGLADLFRGIAGTGAVCTDLPLGEGERPIDDWYVKQVCELKSDERVVRIEARRYYKPGQFAVDPNDNRMTDNQFESSARIEVYRPKSAR